MGDECSHAHTPFPLLCDRFPMVMRNRGGRAAIGRAWRMRAPLCRGRGRHTLPPSPCALPFAQASSDRRDTPVAAVRPPLCGLCNPLCTQAGTGGTAPEPIRDAGGAGTPCLCLRPCPPGLRKGCERGRGGGQQWRRHAHPHNGRGGVSGWHHGGSSKRNGGGVHKEAMRGVAPLHSQLRQKNSIVYVNYISQ